METESIHAALLHFYAKSGFGSEPGKRLPLTVKVYTGCMPVPLPNIETRRKYLKYHDLHHVLSGYGVGRIGEGKTSAWELGTGTLFRFPMLGFMNLIALSTGLFLKPGDMWRAFLSGKRSRNLYAKDRRKMADEESMTVSGLREAALHCTRHRPTLLTHMEFAAYCGMALLIHALIVLPAILVRAASDLISTGSVIETIHPKKRQDIY